MNADDRPRVRRLGVDTYREHVVYLHRDSPVGRAEGFEARSRVELALDGRRIVATLNVVLNGLLAPDEVALSESAWTALGARDGDRVRIAHAPPLESLRHVRAKVHGQRLGDAAFDEIVRDVAAGRWSELHVASFLTACAGDRLDVDETIALTRAMVAVGERLDWGGGVVVDKHSVGGLPGNRTTPIVVAIVAARGLRMPKTSSRAITSPAGTADAMETLAPVELTPDAMRRAVERAGACIAWGGSVRLSPADDVLIRVQRPLDLDGEGQMVASILSKKVAAGSTHVLIDVPVGPGTKVRSPRAAEALGARLVAVGEAMGLRVALSFGDGAQPIGRGVGPALEARDVMAVLRGDPGAPADLRERALRLAAGVLELGGAAAPGEGFDAARRTLDSGEALERFERIRAAQGGAREPPIAPHRHAVPAEVAGTVVGCDNRVISRAAKLAGAPRDAAAGLELHVRLGDAVEAGRPLYTVHAQAPGELAYALAYLRRSGPAYRLSTGA